MKSMSNLLFFLVKVLSGDVFTVSMVSIVFTVSMVLKVSMAVVRWVLLEGKKVSSLKTKYGWGFSLNLRFEFVGFNHDPFKLWVFRSTSFKSQLIWIWIRMRFDWFCFVESATKNSFWEIFYKVWANSPIISFSSRTFSCFNKTIVQWQIMSDTAPPSISLSWEQLIMLFQWVEYRVSQ